MILAELVKRYEKQAAEGKIKFLGAVGVKRAFLLD